MSVSRWAYIPECCDGDACPGDCDLCSKAQDNIAEHEYTMEEFMYGQDMGNPEDGSL